MRKTIRKLLCAIVLSLLVVFASACTFFEGEDVRQIANVYTVRSEDDTGIYIVIEYTGDYPSDRFFIEDPEQGKEGNGIEKIESELVEGATKITIYYTDISRMPTELLLPHGRYIESITTETDEVTHVVTMTITFADGSEPVVLTLQPGRDGKDGDSISRIETEIDEDGNIILHIYVLRYNVETGEYEEVECETEEPIVIPKGEQGKGIVSVEPDNTNSDPYNIYLKITYSDGTYETVPIPRTNTWYTGAGEPRPAWYSIGDFYFDTEGYAIWQKTVTGWVKLVDFSSVNQEEHTVYFFLDNGETLASFTTITHGNSFSSSVGKELPVPEKAGYKFRGWYTQYVDPDDPNAELGPNEAHFTVLTPVLSDIALFARWEKIN